MNRKVFSFIKLIYFKIVIKQKQMLLISDFLRLKLTFKI